MIRSVVWGFRETAKCLTNVLAFPETNKAKSKRRRKSKVFLAKMENPSHIVNNRQTHTMTKRRVDETCKRLKRRSKVEKTTNQTKSKCYGRNISDEGSKLSR